LAAIWKRGKKGARKDLRGRTKSLFRERTLEPTDESGDTTKKEKTKLKDTKRIGTAEKVHRQKRNRGMEGRQQQP